MPLGGGLLTKQIMCTTLCLNCSSQVNNKATAAADRPDGGAGISVRSIGVQAGQLHQAAPGPL